jgi:hypothetical protein
MNSDGGVKQDEEEDDDFPEYANEQNKELNEIVQSLDSHDRSKKNVGSSKISPERSRRKTIELVCCLSI